MSDAGTGVEVFLDVIDRGPVGVAFPPAVGRAGRAVIVGDNEIFATANPGPDTPECRGISDGVIENNRRLLANILDWLAAAPGLDAKGAAALDACTRGR